METVSERNYEDAVQQLREGTHPEVASETAAAWGKGRPWTIIRVLRKGVDDPSGAACCGSQGNHQLECPKKVEAVQYTTTFGDPAWYCEEHAVLQAEWDVHLYDSVSGVKVKKQTPEEIAWWQKFMQKGKKKKEPEKEEEYDPS